ncbi:UNVERIFIED_CONTAM: hypothetical protein Sradi_6035200 [Sesamum radiatum]|uniref:Uncharacterized protein n=1 Tax=Sesamum radiatum TaxID=300843 RepID=A0AAW2KH48_SESRA
MDLESECSVLGSVEDNEEITNDSVSGNLENFGESKVQINGTCSVENNDNDELFPEVEQKEAEVLESVSLPPVDLKAEVSPSPTTATTTRKGYGLKKWRRIKRDAIKGGDSSIATSKMMTPDLPYSGPIRVNGCKFMQNASRRVTVRFLPQMLWLEIWMVLLSLMSQGWGWAHHLLLEQIQRTVRIRVASPRQQPALQG